MAKGTEKLRRDVESDLLGFRRPLFEDGVGNVRTLT